jgi:hypothetical protein
MCHDENKWHAALCNLLHCPVLCSVFASNIFLNTLPSKCTSRTARDQFPNPQKCKEKSDFFYVPVSRQQMGRQSTNVNLRSWEGVEGKKTEELHSPNLLQCKLFVYIVLNVKRTCSCTGKAAVVALAAFWHTVLRGVPEYKPEVGS